MQQELKNLIEKLIDLGEDKEELSFWQTIFDDLTITEQKELIKILSEEIQSLQNNKTGD